MAGLLMRDSKLLLRGNDRDLQIRIIVSAGVDGVPALVDHPVIEQKRLVDRTVALDIEAQALTLAEQGAGRKKCDLYWHDLARLQPLLALKLLNRQPGGR